MIEQKTMRISWDIKKAVNMFESGKSVVQIAKSLGMGRNAVYFQFHKLGINTDKRFKSKKIYDLLGNVVLPDPNTGCWLWTGTFASNRRLNQYGLIKIDGKRRLAHRVSYEQNKGPIPEGMFVCHKCDTPQCVNPDHLFIGTNQDNTRDRDLKGRTHKGPRKHKDV